MNEGRGQGENVIDSNYFLTPQAFLFCKIREGSAPSSWLLFLQDKGEGAPPGIGFFLEDKGGIGPSGIVFFLKK